VLSLFVVYSVSAQQPAKNILHRIAELPVDSRITSLLKQSKTEAKFARTILEKLELTSANFNAAEKYLMLMIKANLVLEPDKDEKIVALLLQTETLVKEISLTQLNSPPFIDASLMLAMSYSATKRFKKAYEHKKDYLERFWESETAQRYNDIEIIDEKYNTNRKNSENELLENQSKLKKLQLKSAENKKSAQLRNIIILVLTAVVFSLLLFRQFKLKNAFEIASRVDYLTQVANRKTLFKSGRQLVSNVAQNGKSIAVLVIKIDGFSEVNDIFGFTVGDDVLKKIALLGRETMRSRDFFARQGDAIFCAVLPEATLGQAKAISERLREKVTAIEPSAVGLNKRLSISIGVAGLQQTRNSSFEQLVKSATIAMHDAQKNGENQVLIYQDS
jgi:diguanylate cyclase (GGDEF)-like protein